MTSRRVLSVGVDVGGTFTDVVTFDSVTGSLGVRKVPTTPDPSVAASSWARGEGGGEGRPTMVSHATTIATNALLTRSGLARSALITNAGFRDVLEIARQRRPDLYDLRTKRPPPLVRRRDRLTVRCRVRADGSVSEPLDRRGALRTARRVAREGFDSVAVCFLNSYANPSHELEMRRLLSEAGYEGNVSLSSEVDREYREYERFSTTAVNASLVPLMSGYLGRLGRSLRRAGVDAPVFVMNSDGGMSTVSFASSHPVAAIESGPAAGVLASRQLAKALSIERVLTFDMGGTTAKAGAVVKGEPEIIDEFEAAGRTHSGRSIKGSGYAVRGSFIDLAEVSAGGGTVAWIDEGGDLRIGPRSAGSVPGPACYGAGGTEPTVTDANVVLGRLNPSHLLGGKMPISSRLASRSFEPLARDLGTTVDEAAEGVIRIVNDSMAKAISIVSVERGRDPRDFALVAFGGSGPVHACDLAEGLGISDVIIPVHAGLFSAYGLLAAELTRTFVLPVDEGTRSLEAHFHELEGTASREMRKEGFPKFVTSRLVEVRYEGQSHELVLPYSGASRLRRAFDARHMEVYGYSASERVEVVNARLRASVRRERTPELVRPSGDGSAPTQKRAAWLGGRRAEAQVVQGGALSPGGAGRGPCIIEEYDTTVVINPGWRWTAEGFGVRLRR